MAKDGLCEVYKRSLKVTKFEDAIISYQDFTWAIRTPKGITFLNLSHDLHSNDKQFDVQESFVDTPKSSPAADLFNNKVMHPMDNMNLTQMIIDSSFWAYNTNLIQEVNIVDFRWCPFNIAYNNDILIAVLNNIGGVELLVRCRNSWKIAYVLSDAVKTVLLPEKIPDNLDSIKSAVAVVTTTAICWSQTLQDKNTCYFVTAQKNGYLLVWTVNCQDSTIKVELEGSINANIGEIVSVVWIPKSNEQFVLVCSNVMGQIVALHCQNKGAKLIKTSTLWMHKDRMITKHIIHSVSNNKITLFCNKHRHILVLILDENLNVARELNKNINDQRITHITKSGDDIYISTVNIKIFKVNLKMEGTALEIDLKLIELKEKYSVESSELNSFTVSPNKNIWCLTLNNKAVQHTKELNKINIILLSANTNEVIPILLGNPSKDLQQVWECIEMLRCTIRKSKTLAFIDLNQLKKEAVNDVYKMKIYLCLGIICENLMSIINFDSKQLLEGINVQKLREAVMASHATSLIEKLNESYQKKGELDTLESESLYGAKEYLEVYCKENKIDICTMLPANCAVVNKTSYPKWVCQCCDENIKGFSCKDGHLNMFCSWSFTPIEGHDYIVCKCCGSTVRMELYQYGPKCIFCDLYLNYYALPT